MKKDIETKDVQRTEYLDKNGLDMLWAKVKENTHNQVEAESNRATIQETRIIETKADKSELGNYAPNTALEALEKKISANTAAISNKQNAGNYLHYETLNNEGYYEIPSVCISDSDGSTKTNISSDEIRVSNRGLGYTFITGDRIRYYYDVEGSLGFDLNSDGIKLQGGDNNHVLTSGGSTIDITQYAKKTDIPEVDTSDFVSKTTTDVQAINSSLYVNDAVFAVIENIPDGNFMAAQLSPSVLEFCGKQARSAIILRGTEVGGENGSKIEIMAKRENPYIMLSDGTDKEHEQGKALKITNEGISNTDNNANHVFATDGSIADLTQYAKKSELPTVPAKTSQLQNDSEFITKSVYDEKIATLEARIAALEAKYAETA